jgi:hypothetical protein
MRTDPRLAAAVLLTFVVGGLVPEAAIVTHDHAGGGAPHAHAVPHRHGDGPSHVHAHQAPVDPNGPAVVPARHSHRQSPFQLAARSVATRFVHPEVVGTASPALPSAACERAALAARSRGPPPPAAR